MRLKKQKRKTQKIAELKDQQDNFGKIKRIKHSI